MTDMQCNLDRCCQGRTSFHISLAPAAYPDRTVSVDAPACFALATRLCVPGVTGQARVLGGASGAQSTTLPAMDAALGITHRIAGDKFTEAMPLKHRQYLRNITDRAQASLPCNLTSCQNTPQKLCDHLIGALRITAPGMLSRGLVHVFCLAHQTSHKSYH